MKHVKKALEGRRAKFVLCQVDENCNKHEVSIFDSENECLEKIRILNSRNQTNLRRYYYIHQGRAFAHSKDRSSAELLEKKTTIYNLDSSD